jgi:arylformamidase
VSDWRNWPQGELERQYDARATVPDIAQELQAYREASAPMYQLTPCWRDVAYGSGPDETLDLFPVAGQPHAPLLVFIHGGYWRALHSQDSVFMAKQFTTHGVAVAALNYTLAPHAMLAHIIDQCQRAVAWLLKDASPYGATPQRAVLSGSSAGAHLAAMLLAPGWQAEHGVAPNALRGGVLLSGLYDLEPVQRCVPNTWLNLSVAQAQALSPQRHLPHPQVPLHVAVAEHDTDEFKRQSRDYAAACRAQGNAVTWQEAQERNHFNIVLDWMDAQSDLFVNTLDLLGFQRRHIASTISETSPKTS